MAMAIGAAFGCSSSPADGGDDATALSEKSQRGFDISPVKLSTDGLSRDEIEMVGYGSYLVNAVAYCNLCHVKYTVGAKWDAAYFADPANYLAGNGPFFFPAAQQELFGTYVLSRNLTPDPKTGMSLTEADFIESMRTGKDHSTDGILLNMPWRFYRWMTVNDLKAIYAFLKALPPISSEPPKGFEQDVKNSIPPIPYPTSFEAGDVTRPLPADDTADPDGTLHGEAIQPLAAPTGLSADEQRAFNRGSYLVNVGICNACHGNPTSPPDGVIEGKIDTANYLTGGRVFNIADLSPAYGFSRAMSSNLIGQDNGYKGSLESFVGVMVQGKHIDDPGQPTVSYPMPWRLYKNMTQDDLEAIYTYITKVPRKTGAADKKTQAAAVYCASDADCGSSTCNVDSLECVGSACAADSDCPACQTCTEGACAAPDPESTCTAQGI
ncbi:hypothetical protein WMF45_44480 [Sorangium sp. So ce448]|uniref:cytochrome C n=1 Tax=Sorangium sp. So ce448 TaxID=3133314 RepID=UPI003F6004EA